MFSDIKFVLTFLLSSLSFVTGCSVVNDRAEGSIRINSDLLDNDNELLAVIGHEMGHVYNKHSYNTLKQKLKSSVIKDFSKAIFSVIAGKISKLGKKLIDAKYSKNNEIEADSYSILLLEHLNRDMTAAITSKKIT